MKNQVLITPAKHLRGEITLPGDKSITHRAIILSSIAEGKSYLKGVQRGKDCLATLKCIEQMGVPVREGEKEVIIEGVGLEGLKEPEDVLNCGNSGTTMRLLAGLLAGQRFYSVLSGDKFLRKRPMKRIVDPLREMGAKIEGREKGNFPPLTIVGGELKGINYLSPIASAQVKSCLLLAGLYAKGKTFVKEPYKSRDHTERMMQYLGISIKVKGLEVQIEGKNGESFKGKSFYIPGDISAGAFFIGAAVSLPGSRVKLSNVGLNPTRKGFIDVLLKMGAEVKISNFKKICEEEVGDIEVRGGNNLRGVVIQGEMIPRLIDEIPILTVVSCFAQGDTLIKDARELRVKETDRIRAIVSELKKMGADIEERKDGMLIKGGNKLRGALVNSWGDHRIAMALAIAGLRCEGETTIADTQCIDTSFPEFQKTLREIIV
ncbi:3-phosphoshikimate 1-carboxyvinyltransferase [Candidatus Aerophobetes bacterium]|nr:3-phosphoshikimate 1-carboxyvinyltransferase [Candidatus Aerophobetes bacterium]